MTQPLRAPVRTSLSRPYALLVALVTTALVAAAAPAAVAETTFSSLSEGTPVPSQADARQQMSMLKPLHCKPGKPLEMMTRGQALRSARSFAVKQVGAAAVTRLEDSADTDGADRAAQTAAGAAMAGAPLAALVALLDAHRQSPKDPNHLMTAAGVLNTFGKGREAVALAKAAQKMSKAPYSTMGIDGKAMLLNNLGQGLTLMKRYAAAEDSLRTATSREPELTEARLNLAIAQACQNKMKPAAKAYRQAQNRQTHTWVETVEPPPGEADEVSTAMPNGEARPPVEEVFDMSGGVDGMFPQIRYPRTWQEATGSAAFDAWQALIDEETQRTQFYVQQQTQLTQQIDWAGLSPVKRNRVDLVRSYIATSNRERNLRDLYQHIQAPQDAVGEALIGYQEEYLAAMDGGADCSTLGAIADKWHPIWRAAIHNLDTALRDHYQAEYRYATALIANIADPQLHQLLMAELQTSRPWYSLLLASGQDWTMIQAGCEQAPLSEGLQADEGTGETPARCAEFLRGVKFAVKIGTLFEVSSNCESLAVEASAGAGWIGAFVEVSNK